MANEEIKALFSSLSSEPDLKRLVSEKTKEGLYLEFKAKADRSHGALDASDARQFSRALSGFANSDGGILIWGIETDKREQASKLKPITDVQEFQSRLKKSLINSTQPVVDGVLLEVILKDGSSTDGYVKCLIPASDKTPHRAMLADREYFKRTTEGFYRLEHFDLEDMFGRRPHPSLSMTLELRPRGGDDPHDELHFAFINSGRGIARYPGFICRFDDNVRVVDVRGPNLMNATTVNRGLPTVTYSENISVIYPNGVLNFVGHAIIVRVDKSKNVHVNMSWYCENMMMRSTVAEIAPELISSTG